MTARYVLHGTWRSGPTYKVALLLSLLGQKFDYVHIDLQAGKNKEADFLKRSRFGQVPCLTDRQGNCSIIQSGAILEYVAGKEERFLPEASRDRLAAREWIFWDFDRLAPNIYRPRARKLGFRPAEPATLQMYMNDGNAALKVIDDELNGRSWLVGGQPTIADVDVYGVVSYAPEGDFDLGLYPNLMAWMSRMQSLSGFRPADMLLPRQNAVDV